MHFVCCLLRFKLDLLKTLARLWRSFDEPEQIRSIISDRLGIEALLHRRAVVDDAKVRFEECVFETESFAGRAGSSNY